MPIATDPIEIKFVLNSDELGREFRDIATGAKNPDEAIAALEERFKQLTAAQVLGVKGAEDVVKAMKNIDTVAKNSQLDEFGLTKENVRIQKQVIKEIEAEYKKLQKQISKTAPGNARSAVRQKANEVKAELDAEKKALFEVENEVKKNQASHELLTTSIRKVKDEMSKLSAEGKQNTQAYAELREKAIEYQQSLDRVNNEVKFLSRGGIQGLVQGLSAVAGGFSAAQGAIGLFAGENKDLQKIMLKVQSLMAVTIGLQQISEALDKRSAFQTKFLTRAKQGLATANTRLATALGISNTAAAALLGTITLGLSVAIPVLINLYQRWNSAAAKTAQLQEDLSKKMVDALADPMIAYKTLQKQWEGLGDDMEVQKRFVTDNQDAFKSLGVEVNNVADAEKLIEDKTGNFIAAMRARAQATAAQQLATEKYREALDKQAELEADKDKAKNGNWFQRLWYNRFNNFQGSGTFNKSAEDEIKELLKTFDDLIDQSIEGENLADKLFNKTGLKKSGKDSLDDFLPPGSVADLKNRLKEIDEALSKVGSQTDDAAVKKLKNDRIKLAEDLAEAEKRIEIQSVKDAIAERKTAWEQYYRFEEQMGTAAAQKQFAGLQQESGSYFEWLKNQREGFEQLAAVGELTPKQQEDFQLITETINELTGQKSDFDNFTAGIDRAIDRAPVLADQLAVVNREIDKLGDDDRNIDNGKLSFLFAKREDIQDQLGQLAQDFIAAQETIEQQRTAIVAKYDAIRREIESREDLDPGEKDRLIQAARETADAEIAQMERAEAERQNVFLRYSRNIIAASKQELKARIQSLEEFLDAGKNILTKEEQDFLQSQIEQAKSLQDTTDARVKENALLAEKERILKKINDLQDGEADQMPALLNQLNAVNKELGKNKFAENAEKVASVARLAGDGFREMANAIGDSNAGLSDTLETMADVLGVVEDAATAAANFSQGNIVGGIASTIQAVSGVFSIGAKARASRRKAEAEIAKREKEIFQSGLDYNKMLRDRLSLESAITEQTKGRLAAIREEHEANKANLKGIEEDSNSVFQRLLKSETLVDQYTKKHGGFLGIGRKTKVVDVNKSVSELLGLGKDAELTDDIFDQLQEINSKKPLTGDAKEAYEQLLKLKEEYGSIEKLQVEIEQEIRDTLAGTTRDSIASSIAEGLKQGKRSFADFADDFQGMLENAVISAFVNSEAVNAGASKLQEIIADAMEDGVLDDDEAAKIRAYYETFLGNAETLMENINQVGLDFGGSSKPSKNSLSGAYAAASQESIDLLSGNTAGLRLAVLDTNKINSSGFAGMLEAMSRSVQVQLDIEKNTRRTAENTEETVRGIDKLNDTFGKENRTLKGNGL